MTAFAKFGSFCVTQLALAFIAYCIISWKTIPYTCSGSMTLTKRVVKKV